MPFLQSPFSRTFETSLHTRLVALNDSVVLKATESEAVLRKASREVEEKADESDEVVFMLLLYRFAGGHTSTRLSYIYSEHTRVVGAMVVEESSGRLRRVSTDCCRLLIEVCRVLMELSYPVARHSL